MTTPNAELAALYERILALIPVAKLEQGYNSVLHDEVSALNSSVNGVTLAFAKLKEVRDAVNKLERSNGARVSRSDSLLHAMDSAMKLQDEVQKKLEKVVSEMSKANKKRKRGEDKTVVKRETSRHKAAQTTAGEATVACKEEAPKVTGVKREKSKTDELQKDADSSWVSDMTPTNCLEVLRMMTQLSVVERSKHVPGVLAKLATMVSSQNEMGRVSILKYVILWANLSAGQGSNLAAFKHFNDAMVELMERLPPSDGLIGMKKLNDSLSALLKGQHDTTGSQKDVQLSYELLVWRVDSMAPQARRKHIHEVVKVLSNGMSQDEKTVQFRELTKAVRTVGQWARADRRDASRHKLYGELAERVRGYADNLLSFVGKVDLYREVKKLEAVTNNAPREDVKAQLEKVLRKAQDLKPGSAAKVDDCILALDAVIRHQEKGWNPRSNRIARQCYQLLEQSVKGLKTVPRNPRNTVMKKWRIRQP